MKRFWLFALMLAGSLAVLTAPAFAKNSSSEEGTDDSSDSSMEDVNSAMGALSSRVGDIEKQLGLKFNGDVRVRVDWRTQSNSVPTVLAPSGTALLTGGPINDQDRPRYRLRFGATKQMGDITAGFRLSTGGGNNPNTENQTFDAGFVEPAINVEQAYITWIPGFLEGHLKLTAGKMANPLSVTPITWDPDIFPDGFFAEISNMNTNTKFRAAYFDLNNQNGGGTELFGNDLYLTGSNQDEFMSNFQLEQLLQFDKDTSSTLMLGYEYVPNVTALAGGTLGAPPNGALALNNALVGGDGMIWNFGKVIPDIQMLEGMITVKHKVGDVPFKWTFHATDNLDSFNIPKGANVLALANPAAPLAPYGALAAAGTYTSFTNQYGFWASVNVGEVKVKNDFAGMLAFGHVEPNAQLGFLTDDDPGNNNREYFRANLAYGLEDNVQLVVNEYMVNHIYYSYLGVANDKLGGTSQNSEFITFFDCVATF